MLLCSRLVGPRTILKSGCLLFTSWVHTFSSDFPCRQRDLYQGAWTLLVGTDSGGDYEIQRNSPNGEDGRQARLKVIRVGRNASGTPIFWSAHRIQMTLCVSDLTSSLNYIQETRSAPLRL